MIQIPRAPIATELKSRAPESPGERSPNMNGLSAAEGVLMKRAAHLFSGLATLGLVFLAASDSTTARADAADKNFVSRTSDVDGVKLHYLRAGHGPTVILLHGYAETSRMWIPILPILAKQFTVIAPDLPGIGDSAIPADGLDMKSAAIRIHALARSLGVQKASVVGHDIGLMVAYAYAAQFPTEVEKLVLMDAFLPGVGQWQAIYNDPGFWHFRFNGPTPEALVRGRERTYFEHFWNDFAADKTRSIPETDRKAYTAAYSRPGRMRAGWAYFVSFPQAAKDFAELARTRLTMPVLVIGGEKALGEVLGQQAKEVASEVTVVVLKDTGHWVLEERPKETTDVLLKFL
jgi:pimeloyl-ACP methyl ester carboxylesterase